MLTALREISIEQVCERTGFHPAVLTITDGWAEVGVCFYARVAAKREPLEFDKACPPFCYRTIFDWAVDSTTTKLCLCSDCFSLDRD